MSKFVEVKLMVNESDLRKIKALHGGDQENALTDALSDYLNGQGQVRINPETLDKIASRAGVDRIRSEADLVNAFEKATKLDENSVVVHIDPNQAPMVLSVAHGRNVSFAQALNDYIQAAINLGWFNEYYLELYYIQMSEAEQKRLGFEFGVPKVRDGKHLLELIQALKAKEQVTA